MRAIIRVLLAGIMLTAFSQAGYAQFFKKIKSHAADVVNQAIDDAVDGSPKQDEPTASAEGTAAPTALHIPTPFDFKPGSEVIFKDDFSGDSTGIFPKYWKTNASGSVVEVPGVPGKWFLLKDRATYKLDTLLSMPENFTVEFDILAAANEADDLSSLYFGFARNNSVSDYAMKTGVAGAVLYYMNDDEYKTASKDLGTYHFGEFNLVNTLNRPLHVSISVRGTHMKMYLGKTRILDAEMFLPDSRKFFFVSAPLRYEHGAKVLIGNVRIAKL